MFQPFCFFVVMLALFLVFFGFVLCFVFVFFLVLVPVYEKKAVFPAILVFLSSVGQKGSLILYFMFLFLFVCLVLFLSILKN